MKYSIIIPVYNAEKTIARTVESIQKNTYRDFEIILIDDCSADSSLKVCNQLKTKYQNIAVLHNEKNSGVSHTRNRGLEAASGQFVLFCDSDDWIEPDYIISFDQFINFGNKDRLLICGYWNHDEQVSGRLDEIIWNSDTVYDEVCSRQFIKAIYDKRLLQQLWNKCFCRELIEKYRIRFDESISIGEDTRFLLEYIQKAEIKRFLLLNKALYHYMRDQSGSLMYRVGYESIEEPLKNLRVLYEIMGMQSEEIEFQIEADRKQQQELYAYLICHNLGMRRAEKYRLILQLDPDLKRGKKLFRKNRILFLKEKVSSILNRRRK